jgi:predicted anti-sigma-YlaC factor YlaD
VTTGGSGPACRNIRQLLGVYVVGAIDPAERAQVDAHLAECQPCRDELAGLAGLPAMLSRVPAADVERLGLLSLPEAMQPPDELLDSLLKKVSAKRKSRMWRIVASVAAAAVIAAGGATAVSQLTGAATSAAAEQASATAGHVSAMVDYAPVRWGMAMRVQVSGLKAGTVCQFWVVGKNGTSDYAGTWTVMGDYGRGYGDKAWYPASSAVAASSVRGFQVTSGGKVLLYIPAT